MGRITLPFSNDTGSLYSMSNVSYEEALAGTHIVGPTTDPTVFFVGQAGSSPRYILYRGFVFGNFALTDIPSGVVVTNVWLRLRMFYKALQAFSLTDRTYVLGVRRRIVGEVTDLPPIIPDNIHTGVYPTWWYGDLATGGHVALFPLYGKMAVPYETSSGDVFLPLPKVLWPLPYQTPGDPDRPDTVYELFALPAWKDSVPNEDPWPVPPWWVSFYLYSNSASDPSLRIEYATEALEAINTIVDFRANAYSFGSVFHTLEFDFGLSLTLTGYAFETALPPPPPPVGVYNIYNSMQMLFGWSGYARETGGQSPLSFDYRITTEFEAFGKEVDPWVWLDGQLNMPFECYMDVDIVTAATRIEDLTIYHQFTYGSVLLKNLLVFLRATIGVQLTGTIDFMVYTNKRLRAVFEVRVTSEKVVIDE